MMIVRDTDTGLQYRVEDLADLPDSMAVEILSEPPVIHDCGSAEECWC